MCSACSMKGTGVRIDERFEFTAALAAQPPRAESAQVDRLRELGFTPKISALRRQGRAGVLSGWGYFLESHSLYWSSEV
jgi:hypothetical protein